MIYSNKHLISELKEGDFIDDVFVVKIKKRLASYKSGFSFSLILSDKTGKTMDYMYWGPDDMGKVRGIYDSIRPDSIVHVQGRVSIYNNRLQLATNQPNIIEALSEDQYNKGDFIKPAKRDPQKMYEGLKEAISLVRDEDIKKLLTNIFFNPDIEQKFRQHPGAIEIHHNWTGGLLQHTMEVLNYCILSGNQFPELNKDFLIAGSLLHDIGKLEELAVTTRIKGTEHGQLIGHLSIGLMFVSKKMDEIEGFDKDTRNKLLHMIASHHGRLEYGSAKEPMFPEAVALYYADEASSKIAEMVEFVADSRSATEDSFMYHPRNSRNIFLR